MGADEGVNLLVSDSSGVGSVVSGNDNVHAGLQPHQSPYYQQQQQQTPQLYPSQQQHYQQIQPAPYSAALGLSATNILNNALIASPMAGASPYTATFPNPNSNSNNIVNHSSSAAFHLRHPHQTPLQRMSLQLAGKRTPSSSSSSSAAPQPLQQPSSSHAPQQQMSQQIPQQIPQQMSQPLTSSSSLAYNILLAEDSPTLIKAQSMMLRRRGHHVHIAENGAIAVRMYEESRVDELSRYDIILMDLQMPVMDGLEAMKRIRKLEDKKPVEWVTNSTSGIVARSPRRRASHLSLTGVMYHQLIVGVSADASEETVDDVLDCGGDGFLAKPFSVASFESLVEELMASRFTDVGKQ